MQPLKLEAVVPMDRAEDLAVMRVNLTAAILWGGQGTRLRPAVADRPKVLAEEALA